MTTYGGKEGVCRLMEYREVIKSWENICKYFNCDCSKCVLKSCNHEFVNHPEYFEGIIIQGLKKLEGLRNETFFDLLEKRQELFKLERTITEEKLKMDKLHRLVFENTSVQSDGELCVSINYYNVSVKDFEEGDEDFDENVHFIGNILKVIEELNIKESYIKYYLPNTDEAKSLMDWLKENRREYNVTQNMGMVYIIRG